MKIRLLYLLLCIVGTVLPMLEFVPWLVAQPLDAGIAARFVAELFSTRIGGFFGLDVIVSALVLLLFIQVEGQRIAMSRRWVPMLGTLMVGVSLGLPLFLYMREGLLTQRAVG